MKTKKEPKPWPWKANTDADADADADDGRSGRSGRSGRQKTKPKPKSFEERVAELLDGIRAGLPIEAACWRAGITAVEYAEWRRRATEPGLAKKYAELVNAIDMSSGELVEEWVTQIKRAEDWRAIAWLIERRFPDLFGRFAVEGTLGEGEAKQAFTLIMKYGGGTVEPANKDAIMKPIGNTNHA